MLPATLLFMQLLGGYRPLLEQSTSRVIVSSLVAPLVGLSCVALLFVGIKLLDSSRALVFSLAFFAAIGFAGYRLAVRAYKKRRLEAGFYTKNVIVVGTRNGIERVYRHFAREVPPFRYQLRGYLTLPGRFETTTDLTRHHADFVPPDDWLGSVDQLGSLLVRRPIHEIIVVDPGGSSSWLHDVIGHCDYFRITLRVVLEDLMGQPAIERQAARATPLRLPAIVLAPPHLNSDAVFIKRAFDIVVSSVLLVLLSPLLLLIAAAIRFTTPGLPVFYPWRVIGYKGRQFTGYKFTTMHADADVRKAELMHLNEMTGPVFKIRDDPRITPLGRFLRKFSLNELPQLWSVLKGDMSLVGPRPAYPNELARYELWHKRKLCVQPGITCLWQVRGRNKISNFDDWVRMDFEYIDNWSLWLDCVILARTFWAVVAGSGM